MKIRCRFLALIELKLTPVYTTRAYNTILWQEGLLIDFLQKLSTTRSLYRLVNISFTVVNEKLFFEPLTRIFLDTLIWPLSRTNSNTNVSLKYFFFLILSLIFIGISIGVLLFFWQNLN